LNISILSLGVSPFVGMLCFKQSSCNSVTKFNIITISPLQAIFKYIFWFHNKYYLTLIHTLLNMQIQNWCTIYYLTLGPLKNPNESKSLNLFEKIEYYPTINNRVTKKKRALNFSTKLPILWHTSKWQSIIALIQKTIEMMFRD